MYLVQDYYYFSLFYILWKKNSDIIVKEILASRKFRV